ncbi:MAG: hypothetical protein ACLQJ0_20205 [Steroidobacteraceae bacterium]
MNASDNPTRRAVTRSDPRLVARIALGFVMAGFAAATAKDTRTSFSVGITVNAVANIERQSAPTELQLSTQDLRRGYIDVLQPTMLVIRSNSANGYALDVTTVAPIVAAMLIHGFDADLRLGQDGGTIIQRWQQPHPVSLSLRFRLSLAPGLVAGRYPWPMRIAVRPLESI